jgi:hypothetical protein
MGEDISGATTVCTFYGIILMRRYLPATFCKIYHGLQRMKGEQGSFFQQKKKSWWQEGLNP